VIRVEEIEDGEQEAEGRQQAERQVRSLMARTAYAADSEIQGYLFDEDADMDLYSAMQLTEIIGADFVAQADGDAEFYLEH
jgi:hypothetical protein